jgi:hypothetical protein
MKYTQLLNLFYKLEKLAPVICPRQSNTDVQKRMINVSKGFTDIFTAKYIINFAQQCSSNVSDSNG